MSLGSLCGIFHLSISKYYSDRSDVTYGQVIIRKSLSLGSVVPLIDVWETVGEENESKKIHQHLQPLICGTGVFLERPQMESQTPVTPFEAVAPWKDLWNGVRFLFPFRAH